MPKPKKPPQTFQQLKTIWYKKLAKSGFEDIEADENNLKVWSTQLRRARSLNTMDAKQQYYYMAEQFLNEFNFKSPTSQIIWEYHSNALSIKNIVKLLNKTRRKKLDHNIVWGEIKTLRKIMFSMYMPQAESV